MTRLIDADALKERKFPNGESEYLTGWNDAISAIMTFQPTIDAVPLDGSFKKMSKGDYLIYDRHWLYEHFDQEIDIQRSAMKSMGYEPALKDTEPHWIPCSERLPEKEVDVLCCRDNKTMAIMHFNPVLTTRYPKGFSLVKNAFSWRQDNVVAWIPLPEPYEVKETE